MLSNSIIRLSLFLVGCIIFSCENQKNKTNNFDVSIYELDNYEERVLQFLKSKEEIKFAPSFDVYFVNIKDCFSCTKTSFLDLFEFVKKTKKLTYILTNNKEIIPLNFSHRKIRFIYFPTEAFEESKLFHSKIYLYQITKTDIKSIEVNSDFYVDL